MSAALRIVVAALATLAVGTAMGDDRQTDQGDQPTGKGAGATSNGDTGQSGGSSSQPAGPTMKDLLGDGYEVKAVSVIPREIVKRGGATSDVDAVAIVLQNGASLAMCYEEYGTFVSDPTTVACTEYK